MYEIGDLLVYSEHGICKVDDICDKMIAGNTKTYYVLHPINNQEKLTINMPVDHDPKVFSRLINKEESEVILESFKQEGMEWIERPQNRSKTYQDIVKSGERLRIAQVLNTLLRKKQEIEKAGKKFYAQDQRLLDSIEDILFKEIAIALDTSTQSIQRLVYQTLNIES